MRRVVRRRVGGDSNVLLEFSNKTLPSPPPIPQKGNANFASFLNANKKARIKKLNESYDAIYKNTYFYGKTPLEVLIEYNKLLKTYNPKYHTSIEYRKEIKEALDNTLDYLKKLKEIDEAEFKKKFKLLQNSGINYNKYIQPRKMG